MGSTFLRSFLFLCAGVFFHMSMIHFFLFSETASYPMIRIWKKPAFASAIQASIQLLAGTLILRTKWRP
jgi:hypothetical protein